MKVKRRLAKTVGLGRIYGMGGGGLGRLLNIADEEAYDLFDNFDLHFPFMKKLADKYTKDAERDGYVQTLAGRRARFPGGDDSYKALNRVVQGTGADMIKISMVRIWERHGVCPIITLHDDISYSIFEEEFANEIVEIMEEALDLQIPQVVDVKIGDTWQC